MQRANIRKQSKSKVNTCFHDWSSMPYLINVHVTNRYFAFKCVPPPRRLSRNSRQPVIISIASKLRARVERERERGWYCTDFSNENANIHVYLCPLNPDTTGNSVFSWSQSWFQPRWFESTRYIYIYMYMYQSIIDRVDRVRFTSTRSRCIYNLTNLLEVV